MAGRFPSSWVDELFARADIVQVVSDYVQLKQRGQRYWACCPFHHEKTPSFSVNPDLNVYHCFGCKAGGNVVHFIMEMERLTYPEALEFLARRMNMPLPEKTFSRDDVVRQSLKERLYAANEAAARFFHERLWRPEGAKQLEYLHRRGIEDAAIRKFGLGAAPDGWTELADALTKKGFTLDEMQQAGLIAVKEKHHYDMFRDRVMFPIINLYGKVLGFGGRAMGDMQPKYLNTSDTPVFNKRFGVYAANLLRVERKLERVLLVEGYMDVISLTQRGIKGAVATLGTALTEEQARFMKRYAPEIWIAYDGDEAGQKAIERAIGILRAEDVPVRVLQFPDGMDPDEMMQKHGLEGFEKVRPVTDMTFGLGRIQKGCDLSQIDGRMAYAKKCAKLLARLPDPVEIERYLAEVAVNSGFSKDALLEQVRVEGGRVREDVKKQREKLSYRAAKTGAVPAEDSAEETLVSLLSSGRLPKGVVRAEDFASEDLKLLAEKLLSGDTPAKVLGDIDDDALRQKAGRLFGRETVSDPDKALAAAEECLNEIRKRRTQGEIQRLSAGIDNRSDEERRRALEQIMRMTGQGAGKSPRGDEK